MAILSEGKYLGDVMKLEIGEAMLYSRDIATLLSGQNLALGAVVAPSISGATATETHAGNTGNGVMTLDATAPVLGNAQAGIYTARCTVAATNGGTFRVFDPTGDVNGDVLVGATYSDQIKFVIADGATDFIVGDTFLITVAVGAKVTVLGPAATDGSQFAAGILAQATDASAGDVSTVVIARNAILAANKVVWPVGITAAQKAIATAQLARVGIVLRTGV